MPAREPNLLYISLDIIRLFPVIFVSRSNMFLALPCALLIVVSDPTPMIYFKSGSPLIQRLFIIAASSYWRV
jgi:hypothetical protein